MRGRDRYRDVEAQDESDVREAVRGLRLRRRVDPVSLKLVAYGLGALAFAALVLVLVGRASGWFDPPLAERLEDDRLLTNLREPGRFLDVAYHPERGLLYIAQQGNRIHSYDPATRLWSTEEVAPPGLGSPIVQLLAGCGADLQGGSSEPCADSSSLWGRTRLGGLAREVAGDWEVVVPDTRMVAIDGTNPSSEDLNALVASSDGRWVLAGTARSGVGLYDVRERSWVEIPIGELEELASPVVSKVVWWRDRFWIGGPKGIAFLEPHARRPDLERVEGVDGAVLDLDARRALYVVERNPCENDSRLGCHRVQRLAEPERAPETILDERNRYTDLSLGDVEFAHERRGVLTLAGSRGVDTYRPASHGWKRLEQGRVLSWLGRRDSPSLVFGLEGLVVRTEGLDARRWELPGRSPVRLFASSREEALALTDGGSLYSLRLGREPAAVYDGGGPPDGTRPFLHGVGSGDQVLLLGRAEGVVHDVRQRTYEHVASVPPELLVPEVELAASGDQVYALLPAGQNRTAVPFRFSELAKGKAGAATLSTIPAPRRGWRAWSKDRVAFADANDHVHFVSSTGADQLTPSGGPGNVVDVVAEGGTLWALEPHRLHTYSLSNRTWSVVLSSADRLEQIERFGSRTLLRGAGNHLVELIAGSSRSRAQVSQRVGSPTRLGIPDAALTDVRTFGGKLVLAGRGRVAVYDRSARQVQEAYPLGSGGPGRVEIVGMVASGVVAQKGRELYLRTRRIDASLGPVEDSFLTNSRLVTVRRAAEGHRFLASYALNDLAQDRFRPSCTYLEPSLAMDRGPILDAREVGKPGDGPILVAQRSGLALYDRAARRWYRGPSLLLGGSVRLHRLGDTTVATGASGFWIIPDGGIQAPTSCSRGTIPIARQPIRSRAVSVDEAAGRVGWLDLDGNAWEWQAGNSTRVHERSAGAPRPGELRRAYAAGDRIVFATDSDLRVFDTRTHGWSRITLPQPPARIEDIDFGAGTGRSRLIARLADGSTFVVDLSATLEPETHRMVQFPDERFGVSGAALLDVQERTNRWVFVHENGIRSLHLGSREWRDELVLRQPDPTLSLRRLGSRRVAEADGGRTWWIEQLGDGGYFPYSVRPGRDVALGADGWIYELEDGVVRACDPGMVTRPYADCEPLNQPIELGARTTHAYEFGDLLLFFEPGRWRAYDTTRRAEEPVPDALAHADAPQTVLEVDRGLWILDRRGTLLRVDREAAGSLVAEPLAEGIQSLVTDDGGEIYARLPEGWRRWEGQWVPLAPEEVAPGRVSTYLRRVPDTAELHVVRTDLDPDGILSATPPSAPAVKIVHGEELSIQSAFVGLATWWLVAEGRLYKVKPADCPSDEGSEVLCGRPDEVGLLGRPDGETPPLAAVVELAEGLVFELGSSAWQVVDPHVAPRLARADPTSTRFGPANAWRRLSAEAEPAAGVGWRYGVVESLVEELNGSIRARGSSVDFIVTGRGGSTFKDGTTLDALAIKWRRADRSFEILSPHGALRIPATDFVRGGALLFEGVEAVVALDSTRVAAANRHGIWIFRTESMRLSSLSSFEAVDMPGPIRGAHRRFVFSGGIVAAEGSAAAAGTHRFSYGQLTVEEDVGRRQVSAQVRLPSGPVAAFRQGEPGFAFDRHRGIAYDQGRLLVRSELGVHPPAALDAFRAGPAAAAPARWEAATDSRGRLLAVDGSTVWALAPGGGWRSLSADPREQWTGVDTSTWTWSFSRNSGLQVRPKARTQALRLLTTGGSLGFTSDHLRAAAYHDGSLHVMTDAHFIVAADVPSLRADSGTRHAAQAAERLRSVRDETGKAELYRWSQGHVSRWDRAAGSFASHSGADPMTDRWLAGTARTRFVLRNGSVSKTIELEDASGRRVTKPFSLHSGRLPWDVVTSIAVFGNRLLVGSPVGLQVYDANRLRLDDAERVMDMGRGAKGPIGAVTRLGLHAASGSLRVESAHRCLETRALPVFQSCVSSGSFARHKGANHLWGWTVANGRPRGRYHVGGVAIQRSARITGGRFPHDRILDVARCLGEEYSLATDGWLVSHEGGDLSLSRAPRRVLDLSSRNPRSLVCVDRKPPNDPNALQPGLYVGFEPRRFARLEGTALRDITAGWQRRLLERWRRNAPLLYRGRLRALSPPPGDPIVFEHRLRSGRWVEVPWDGERLGIDRVEQVAEINPGPASRWWLATRAGFVDVRRTNGRFVLDPDDFTWIREPRDCADVSDLRVDGSSVIARCGRDSTRVYRGGLRAGNDTGVMHSQPDDPFANRLLVENTDLGWSWRRIHDVAPSDGDVVAEWKQQSLALSGGRFPFDDPASIALLEDGQLDLVTRPGGWFRVDVSSSLGVKGFRRPPDLEELDPLSITRASVVRHGDESRLCVESGADSGTRYWRMAPGLSRATEEARCREDFGDDGLWQYAHDGDSPSVANLAGDAALERRLRSGRFDDDVVTGLPVPVETASGSRVAVPTLAGLAWLDGSSRRFESIEAPCGEGRVVFSSTPEGGGGVSCLADWRELSKGSRVRDASPVPHPLLRLRYVDHRGHHFHVLRQTGRGDFEPAYLPDTLELRAEPWPAFQRLEAERSLKRLPVRVGLCRSVFLQLADGPRGLGISLDGRRATRIQPLGGMNLGGRLVLVEPREVWDVALDHALRAAFEERRSPRGPVEPVVGLDDSILLIATDLSIDRKHDERARRRFQTGNAALRAGCYAEANLHLEPVDDPAAQLNRVVARVLARALDEAQPLLTVEPPEGALAAAHRLAHANALRIEEEVPRAHKKALAALETFRLLELHAAAGVAGYELARAGGGSGPLLAAVPHLSEPGFETARSRVLLEIGRHQARNADRDFLAMAKVSLGETDDAWALMEVLHEQSRRAAWREHKLQLLREAVAVAEGTGDPIIEIRERETLFDALVADSASREELREAVQVYAPVIDLAREYDLELADRLGRLARLHVRREAWLPAWRAAREALDHRDEAEDRAVLDRAFDRLSRPALERLARVEGIP